MTTDFGSMPDSSLEEMIEKLCIITHLFDREFDHYKNYNNGDTVLKTLWDQKFKNEDITNQKIKEMYEKANQPYREILQQSFKDDLNTLKIIPATGRMYIESYHDCQARFDKVKFKI
jgi:uncharacterized protein YnzC (UPF0291/DUF896 family)